MATWRKKALQSRSKDTEKALAHAARELLSNRSFSEIRVDEVAREAGLSVGGFYARFQGKNALLHLADIDFLEDSVMAFEAVIPENFDWSNIPADYKDAVWDIQFDFDLNAATIVLPEGVTLYFTGGSLSNGTVTGDGTSTIVSKTKYQVFEDIDLAGTFVEEQYLMPYWFGAVMNGITDDRDVFVETLAQSYATTTRVMVDKDIFLDVGPLNIG